MGMEEATTRKDVPRGAACSPARIMATYPSPESRVMKSAARAINARGDWNRRKSCNSARIGIAVSVSMPRKHRNQPTGSRSDSAG